MQSGLSNALLFPRGCTRRRYWERYLNCITTNLILKEFWHVSAEVFFGVIESGRETWVFGVASSHLKVLGKLFIVKFGGTLKVCHLAWYIGFW